MLYLTFTTSILIIVNNQWYFKYLWTRLNQMIQEISILLKMPYTLPCILNSRFVIITDHNNQ